MLRGGVINRYLSVCVSVYIFIAHVYVFCTRAHVCNIKTIGIKNELIFPKIMSMMKNKVMYLIIIYKL